jgi:hypothetical protein
VPLKTCAACTPGLVQKQQRSVIRRSVGMRDVGRRSFDAKLQLRFESLVWLLSTRAAAAFRVAITHY